jgi:hypothetical protein
MTMERNSRRVNRRAVVHGVAALAGAQITTPFIIQALGETPLKVGMVDPITGVYAALAQNEVIGAKLSVDQINAKAPRVALASQLALVFAVLAVIDLCVFQVLRVLTPLQHSAVGAHQGAQFVL